MKGRLTPSYNTQKWKKVEPKISLQDVEPKTKSAKIIYNFASIASVGITLSEDVEVVYLREKFHAMRRKQRTYTAIAFAGIAIAAIAFVLYGGDPLPSLLGMAIIAVGLVGSTYYDFEKDSAAKRLEKKSHKASLCPECGKEIPKADFAYCPFCGSSLKP